jgi:hypothetical protein
MEANVFPYLGARLLDARDRLTAIASEGGSSERRMAKAGANAVFQEALLGALRAHLAELRTVAR